MAIPLLCTAHQQTGDRRTCECGFLIRYPAGVDIKVLEGALVQVPTNAVKGMDRRAFGEFIGPQGELASYAFGWTTGSDPHVARLSVGIGAGNPGGGTFHAVIFENEDGHAFSLTDDRSSACRRAART
jgi:hypothetical protein